MCPIRTLCFIFLKIDMTEEMMDEVQEKIHEVLYLTFINQ
jgi:hypothetical protein